MAEQLIKKTEEGYSNVMPKSWIEAITDKSTGESLTHILQGFNMYFLSYTGNTEQTRCQVSKILRRKGLWITYVKYDGNVYTEWYNSNDIDDKSWGNSSNWRVGNNELVGDLTISANGNWVINGNETEFRAVGEKGNTPLIRIANNKLQVSYDTGNTYHNVDDNPVYTQIRTYNNKLQISTDLGANWVDASDEIAAYFRFNSGQGNNIGNIQISRNNKDWNDLSGNFVNNLHISKYIGADETLPTSGIAEGTIYAKGPTYADSDTSHSNPIYRLWVYAYKGNTLAWQDNGEFTSISAGVVQELGNSENLVVSQKCVSQEIIQGGVYDVSAHNNNAVFESLQALLSNSNLSTLIPPSVRHGGMSIKFIQGSEQSSDNKYVQFFLTKNQWSAREADWEKMNLEKEVNSSPAYYDRTDFLSEDIYVGDIGVHAYVLPTSGHREVKSKNYRYIWVKVLAGDSIHTYTKGYTDNVSIGFSTDRSFENFTVLDATTGTRERSATAQSDGYFFIGFIYTEYEALLNNKIWCEIFEKPSERSLAGIEIGSDYIQLVARASQTGTISYSKTKAQTTLIYKVQKGDIISSKVRQYSDTAAIFFSASYPSVGGEAKCLVVGVGTGGSIPLTLREATVPDDGYVGITYLNTLSSPIAEQKVFTEEPLFYGIIGIEGITNEVDKKKEIDLLIDDATDIKNIQAVGTSGQTATVSSVDVQTSLIYKVRKGETIKARIRQYADTASISFSENIPVVGSSVKVLDVGTLSAKDVQGTAPSDGYIMLTYLNNLTDPISNIKIVRLIYNYDYEFKKIDRRVDKAIDFRNAIQFTPAQMENGSSMQNWTGQDVINNIYEPLRALHPEYITRRSLGKDPTNTYDIWLYEFNNNVDELFGLQQKTSFASNIILPEESGLTAKQCAIKKTTFDEFFAGVQYKNIYFLVSFSVRKLEVWTSKVETTINGETYYVFTFDSDVAITTVSGQSALEVWWTKAVKTYDQHCMIISGVHADEVSGYIGTGLALKYLVENHANNPSLDYIYNHVKLSVVPIFNVWGANQSPKSRTDYYGKNTNVWVAGNLTHEQQIVADYVESVKDELSFFADFHTSEFWNNYGFVYAITIPHVTLYPAIVAAANYLCKHWFPNLPPYNWNIGGASPTSGTIYSVKYMYNTFGIQGSNIESCGKDLMAFGNCEKWSAQYMTYVVENYLNFLLAICCIRIKNNSKNIKENDNFDREVMS